MTRMERMHELVTIGDYRLIRYWTVPGSQSSVFFAWRISTHAKAVNALIIFFGILKIENKTSFTLCRHIPFKNGITLELWRVRTNSYKNAEVFLAVDVIGNKAIVWFNFFERAKRMKARMDKTIS